MNELRHEYMCVCVCESKEVLAVSLRAWHTTNYYSEHKQPHLLLMNAWVNEWKKRREQQELFVYRISVCCIVIIIMSSNILLLSTYLHEQLTLLLDIILRVTITLWRSGLYHSFSTRRVVTIVSLDSLPSSNESSCNTQCVDMDIFLSLTKIGQAMMLCWMGIPAPTASWTSMR